MAGIADGGFGLETIGLSWRAGKFAIYRGQQLIARPFIDCETE